MIVIEGGSVLTPDGLVTADVAIEGEQVSEVGALSARLGGEVIPAHGCLVGPGFVDIHTHLRDPGQTWKEDLESGSAAAAAGGFTAVTAMPNTDPPLDDPKQITDVIRRGRDIGLVSVEAAAAVTLGRAGAEVGPLEELYAAGARLFTDDGDPVASTKVLEEALERLAKLPGAVLAQHAEGPHGAGRDDPPPEAEEVMVRRDLGVLERRGGRYHLQHVSTAATVEMVAQAKRRGLGLTTEAAPHHLTLDRAASPPDDPNFKMYPPLRTASDREALAGALANGAIDLVATDHAPHTAEEKEVGYEQAPRGVIGLETAASAVWSVLEDPDALFRVLSMAPARLAGLGEQGSAVHPGMTANLVVFDPNQTWTPRRFVSKSQNSPFLGRELPGKVVATLHRGAVTHRVET